MAASTETLETLIATNCPDMRFVYGQQTIQFGNSACRIVLDKTKEAESEYSGLVITNCRIGDESRSLVFEILRDNDDVVAYGKLRGGGRFSFPYDEALDGRTCRLQICHLSRKAGGSPPSLRRRSRPELMRCGLAQDNRRTMEDPGAIQVVGSRIYVAVPSLNLPFDLLVVVASDNGARRVATKVYFLPDDGSQQSARAISIPASEIIGCGNINEYTIDAWGLTAGSESQAYVTDELLNDVSQISEKARTAVEYFQVFRDLCKDVEC